MFKRLLYYDSETNVNIPTESLLCKVKNACAKELLANGDPPEKFFWGDFLINNIHYEVFIKKIRRKKFKNANFHCLQSLHCISNWLNVCLDSKFQVAMMFNGWGNHEQTHNFGICV